MIKMEQSKSESRYVMLHKPHPFQSYIRTLVNYFVWAEYYVPAVGHGVDNLACAASVEGDISYIIASVTTAMINTRLIKWNRVLRIILELQSHRRKITLRCSYIKEKITLCCSPYCYSFIPGTRGNLKYCKNI